MSDYLNIDNLVIPQGSTFARAWPVSGVPMSGAVVLAQVRTDDAAATLLYEFVTTLVPLVGGDGNSGTYQVACPPADSWDFDWTEGVYDAVLKATDGSISRVAQGSVTVNKGVTRLP